MINAKEKMEQDFETNWQAIQANFTENEKHIKRNSLMDVFFEAFKSGMSVQVLQQKEMQRLSVLDSKIYRLCA